jgi:NAD(P)-dependent dehydrogenase (short-subunit alcohol dehydrogenase family)/acyl carrier protein
MTFAQAASIPSVFGTAHFALGRVAGLKAGDRVLIHAAAGGVGLAAVALALGAGAEVFATAGSPEKRDYLRGLGVAHVMDSRTLDFADEVLRLTEGRGVDVVLNSLAGEFIPKSLAVVRRGGCFLELGRTAIWTAAQVEALGRKIRYEPVFFADVCARDPGLVRTLLEEVCAGVAEGRLPLPPVRSFRLDEAVLAFRFMAQARHIGKLVLTVGSPSPSEAVRIREDGIYLITGGLGGLGLEVARALVQRGAKHLVLAGRSAPSEAAGRRLEELRASGATVRAAQLDVANAEETRLALERLAAEGPPLRGIVHAAGILDDGLIAEQDVSRFERVLGPKAVGAFNLHQATLGSGLDFFVCFSSAASVLGAAGQGSYAAANGFMDALARHRRGRGLSGLSVNWGAWAEVGMAARLGGRDRARLQERGLSTLSPAEGTRLLLELIGTDLAQVVAVPADWRRYAQADLSGSAATFLADLVQGEPAAAPRPAAAEADLSRRLEAVPAARRHALLVPVLHDLATSVLGLEAAASIDPHRPLKELGLDSLMAVELRNAVAAKVGRRLPATLLFDHPTLDALAEHLLGLLSPAEAGAPAASEGAEERAAAAAEVQSLSEEEAEALLVKELDALGQGDRNG